MTRTQFMRKYRDLCNQAHRSLLEKGEAALKSGAINLEDFQDDYAMPKIVMTAALSSTVYDWRPLHPQHRKHVKNLSHFMQQVF